MITSRTNKAVSMMALSCILLIFGSGCQAWTTISNNNSMMRGPRIGSNTQSTQASIAAVTAPHATTTNNSNDSNEMKLLLQSALQHARNTDLLYGLCTPESTYAWSIVDELYISMPEYSSAVEDNVRKVFGTK